VRKWLTTAIELPTHNATVAMNAPPIWKIGICRADSTARRNT
jgi:hypothetical protein